MKAERRQRVRSGDDASVVPLKYFHAVDGTTSTSASMVCEKMKDRAITSQKRIICNESTEPNAFLAHVNRLSTAGSVLFCLKPIAYSRTVFHRPRRKITMQIIARSEKDPAMAINTPWGPI